MEMQEIIRLVQAEWHMSDADKRDGLISTFAAAVARRAVAAECERLRVMVDEVREANAAAQGGGFTLLTPRQEFAWRALMAEIGA